jgi:hypothetical protein
VLLRKPRKIASVNPMSENGTKFIGIFQRSTCPCKQVTRIANAKVHSSCGTIIGRMEPRQTNSRRNQ